MGKGDTRRFGNSRGSRGDDAVRLADHLLLSEP